MPNSIPDACYFQNPAATINHVAGEDFLRLHWSAAKTSPDELRAVYQHTLRAFTHFGYRKLLSDHSQRPPMPSEVSTWLAEEWIPRAVREAGYSHCAVVDNSTPLGRLAAQAVGAQLPPGLLTFRYFPTLAEALGWLRTQ
ncbi:hypothetical protein EJV47_21805 [Hymenobacter gummosus]|uniref:STAS/SEC14 domain-containing protein n=1 Tax=Hymenobacter gummosus TaxID=1776032 RepID=A0A3S0H6N6_9BACT|nr:hypothetical protein [Hymenobacter gummosus]RTQ46586.1 hypothetical protein EJV47_21805 [Hymenobacter gummosus]